MSAITKAATKFVKENPGASLREAFIAGSAYLYVRAGEYAVKPKPDSRTQFYPFVETHYLQRLFIKNE